MLNHDAIDRGPRGSQIGGSPERLKQIEQEFSTYKGFDLDDPLFEEKPGLRGPVKPDLPSYPSVGPGRVASPTNAQSVLMTLERPEKPQHLLARIGFNWFPWAEQLFARDEAAAETQTVKGASSEADAGWWPFDDGSNSRGGGGGSAAAGSGGAASGGKRRMTIDERIAERQRQAEARAEARAQRLARQGAAHADSLRKKAFMLHVRGIRACDVRDADAESGSCV